MRGWAGLLAAGSLSVEGPPFYMQMIFILNLSYTASSNKEPGMDSSETAGSIPRDYGVMNPKELLEELQDCIRDKAYREAVLKIGNYYRWRLRGGFEPDMNGNTRGDKFVDRCVFSLADALDENPKSTGP